jgi:hypothetical protein
MRRAARPFFSVVILTLCGLVVPPRGALAAQGPLPKPPPKGTQTFRLILHASGLTPITEYADLEDEPQKSLLIVLGKLERLDQLNGELRDGVRGFLEKGGAILVASDMPQRARVLNELYRILPNGAVVKTTQQRLWYRGQDLCPFVTEFRDHPLFRNVKTLATNVPTYLEQVKALDPAFRELHPLAHFPRGCQDGRGRPLEGEPLFMVGNDRPAGGTDLILGGHGVFMNGMMLHLDNVFFAKNSIDWLTKDEAGTRTRTRVLFIEENQIQKKFDVPLVALPPPPIPPVEWFNGFLRRLEDENFFNKAVLSTLGAFRTDDLDQETRMDVGRQRLVRWGLIALTLLLFFYALRRFWGGRHRTEVGVYLTAGAVARDVSTEILTAQRHQGLIHQGNLWETALEMARQCFTAYTARAAGHPPGMPRAVVREGTRQGALARQVRELWQLAYGERVRRVTAVQLRRVAADARAVKEALASGALNLQEPPPPDTPHPVRRPTAAPSTP